jgi:hypothetical protein
VANLAASVAGLATFAVQWTAIGGSAVARDVAKFSASIAFHGLSLAIARVMVGSSALVARRSTGNAAVSTTETALKASARPPSATSSTGSSTALARAITLHMSVRHDAKAMQISAHCKMSGLATGVASSARSTA